MPQLLIAMKRIAALFLILMIPNLSFAKTFELSVEKIECPKCVQKIYDYFQKYYGPRVQNLKIDMNQSKIKFDSISVDSVEMDNIVRGLDVMQFKVTNIEPQFD